MKKMIFTLMALMLTTMAMGQVLSTPDGNDSAYANLEIQAEVPGQVEFRLPSLTFTLDPNSIQRGNVVDLNIQVTNTTNRAIVVGDSGADVGGLGDGWSITPEADITLSVGETDYFTYTIRVTDDQTDFDAAMAYLQSQAAVDASHVNSAGLAVWDVTLVANAVAVTPDSTTTVDIP